MKSSYQYPSKVRDVIRITTAIYLFLVPVCAVLVAFVYFKDQRFSGKSWSHWTYPVFTFGTPAFACIIIWIASLRDLKFRQNDPYRFALKQYRYYIVPDHAPTALLNTLEALAYTVTVQRHDSGGVELVAVRKYPKNIDRFHEKRYPYPITITISGVRESGAWHFQLMGRPVGWMSLADFRSTVYDSLEELTEELQWRSFLQV